MQRLLLFMMVSLDGYYQRPNGEIDWHVVDDEFNEFAIAQLDSVSALVFGRVTYQGMASYWPTPQALEDDPAVTKRMNQLPKIVISRTLERADWNNTRLVRDNAAQEIARLKAQADKDLIIFGSGDLVVSLAEQGLIDEYRIMVAPVVLGAGKSLFHGLKHDLKLELLKTQTFRVGNVLLYYQPAPATGG